jgi:hypothetical protein
VTFSFLLLCDYLRSGHFSMRWQRPLAIRTAGSAERSRPQQPADGPPSAPRLAAAAWAAHGAIDAVKTDTNVYHRVAQAAGAVTNPLGALVVAGLVAFVLAYRA